MRFLLFILLFALCAPHLSAERYAYLLALRAGTPELTAENRAFCGTFYELLKQKGFKPEHILWLSTEQEPGTTLDASLVELRRQLAKSGKELKENDELYIFSIGYISVNERRVSLSTTGGRMLGREFTELLDKIKARQFIFLFNTQGSALFDKLAKGNRLVVAATDDDRQMNPPLYPRFFLQEWAKDKGSTNWFELLQRTGKATEEYYKQHKMARTENSRFFNNGMTASYPFVNAGQQNLVFSFNTETDGKGAAGELSNKLAEQARRYNRKQNEPTKESRALYAAAELAAKPYSGFGAVYTNRNIKLIVNSDKSAKIAISETIFINSATGAGNFVYFSPGKGKITEAQVIFKNGNWVDYNQEPVPRGQYIRFNGLTKDCVLRRAVEIAVPAPSHLPEFQETFQLQTYFPTVQTELFLQSEPENALKFKLYNSDVKPQVKNGATIFKFGPIPAYSPLPFDDDPAKHLIRITATTLDSWKSFNEWTARMTNRSAKMDKDAEVVLNGLVANAKNDTEKIRAIYDYLCSLRYLTEPVGAGAFRPRTPGDVIRNQFGDCKDKANALVTMADKLGIKAYRVLLNRMGESDFTFPSWQFNHMLVYVPELPGYPGGLWLDPTDGSTKFGHLPPGDAGRFGMILKKDGFEFKKVFTQENAKNIEEETITLVFDPQKKQLSGSVLLRFSGMADYQMRHILKRQTPVQTDYFVRSKIDSILNGFQVKTFTIRNRKEEQTKTLELLAEVQANSGNFHPSDVAPPGNLRQYFIAENRTGTIKLASGEPYEYVQELEVKNAVLPEFKWKQETPYLAAEIISGNSRRTVRITIKNPFIPQSAYLENKRFVMKLNSMLKQWRNL